MASPDGVLVDLPVLVLHVTGTSQQDQDLVRDYWDHVVSENGKLTWVRTVAAVVARDGRYLREHSSAVAALVGRAGQAEAKFLSCDMCAGRIWPSARSQVPATHATSRTALTCPRCRSTALTAAKKYRQANRVPGKSHVGAVQRSRTRLQARVAFIADTFPLRPDETSPSLQGCTFANLVALDALLIDLPATGVVPAAASSHVLIGANRAWVDTMLGELRNAGVIAVHPQSTLAAFTFKPETGGPIETPDYRPGLVTWQVNGAGTLADRAASMLVLLQELLDGHWSITWAEQVAELARTTVAHEAARYYEQSVAFHNLPPVNVGEQQNQLDAILFEYADHFSLGQLRTVIWGVATAGATNVHHHRALPPEKATKYTLARIERYLRDARNKSWNITHTNREHGVRLAAATKTMFRALELNPVTATHDSVVTAARKHLTRLDAATASILAGVTATECADAFTAMAGLTARLKAVSVTGIPHGVNTTTAALVLKDLGSVLCAASAAGISDADAFKAAYLGLGRRPPSDPEYAIIASEIQRFIREAVSGSLRADTNNSGHDHWLLPTAG